MDNYIMKINSKKFYIVIAILFLVIVSGCSKNEKISLLTEEDVNEIDNYVKKVSVRDSIGQIFMVGVSADIGTADNSSNDELKDIVSMKGVGSIIVNGYNYYDDKSLDSCDYLSRIINFNNILNEKSLESKLRLPLLIATDFEGPSFTSIKRGLYVPPSALTIGTTQDKDLIQNMGAYVGVELRNIGISIILGPVLDIYNIKQGNKNTLQDRCFAATSEGVAATASHYIKGLKSADIAVFAKHFPGHGGVETNPHLYLVPVYEGSKEQLISDMIPFEVSKDSIDGIMTSHIVIGSDSQKSLATISGNAIGYLKSKELNSKIIITDDISEMGSIKKYMNDNNENFESVAIKSFDAGHDILLFAHCKTSKVETKNNIKILDNSIFTQDRLSSVMNRLSEHIESSAANIQKFKHSLRKILILKANIAKSKGISVGNVLSQPKNCSIFRVEHSGRSAINLTDIEISRLIESQGGGSCPIGNSESSLGDMLVLRIIRNAAVLVNNRSGVDLNILNRSGNERIIFCTYGDQIPKFQEAFSAYFKNASFLPIPLEKGSNAFTRFEKEVSEKFENGGFLVYTAFDDSDADLLRRLRNKTKRDFSSNVIVFCHNSPSIFDNVVLNDAVVIGTFTKHPISFGVDVEILTNRLAPKGLSNLPINIGDNGKFYGVNNTVWIDPADTSSFDHLVLNRKEEACKRSLGSQYILIPRSFESIGTVLAKLLSAVAICVLLHFVPCILEEKGEGKAGRIISVLAHHYVKWVAPILLFIVLIYFLFYYERMVAGVSNLVYVYDQLKLIKFWK